MKNLKGFKKQHLSVLALILMLTSVAVSPLSADWPRGGSVSWSSAPKESPNGWYYMYDDASDQPFREPELPPMPAVPYSNYTLHDQENANKLAPYNNEPYQYSLADSFWYYGGWYEPGDNLYISPDGWVSFDNVVEEGFPNPPSTDPPIPNPDDPNALIAPLWANYNPTLDTGNVTENRVYYHYDMSTRTLRVEWYRIKGAYSYNRYTFMTMLSFGGQDMLDVYGSCGVISSSHLVHFLYHTASAGWDADGGVTGIESHTGNQGIFYKGNIQTTDDEFHAVRSGYKRIFTHDIAAQAILSPGSMVLRWTKIEPKVVVRNVGQETEHLTATLDIYDEAGDRVYHHVLAFYDLLPDGSDTAVAPCWEPEEIGNEYTKVLYTSLERDECHYNDTLETVSYVHCDDTLLYSWDAGDWIVGWGITDTLQVATFFEVDDGALISGGKMALYSAGEQGPWDVGLWEAEDGCGLPKDPPKITTKPDQGKFSFDPPVYLASAEPGNIWAGVIPLSGTIPASYEFYLDIPAPSHPCYLGEYGRSAYRKQGEWVWGLEDNWVPTLITKLYTHLTFGPYPLSAKPSPPCYHDEPHDLTCYRMEKPNIDYLQAGIPVTPKLAIANMGLAAEPDAGFFPVKFMAVDTESGDTTFADSTLIDHIGFLGDETDDPDTLLVPIETWTPEGRCEGDREPFIFYELIGVVRLGEVGPDQSDHCPYNDTVRREVTSLWSHDVGVTELTWPEEPDEPPDDYYPGSQLTFTATVENFGFHAEHDFPIRIEVRDADSNDVLLWQNTKTVKFLNWRGNTIDDPYTIEITFPTYTIPNKHHQVITCRTELVGDDCPENDFEVRHISYCPPEVAENKSFPAGFGLEVEQAMGIEGSSINFAVPRPSRVKLAVFDINGRKVSILEDRTLDTGYYQKSWQGKDQRGRKVAAGIYLVKMQAEGFSSVKKLVLIR